MSDEKITKKVATEIAVQVLDEWAEAIRGDWSSSSIDGRGCRNELQAIAKQANGETRLGLRAMRERAGVCPAGRGHWPQYCEESCEVSDAVV